MAKGEVTESLKARVKFEDGSRFDFDAKGSVVLSIVSLFEWLPPKRREGLLRRLNEAQTKLLEKEAAREAGTAEER